MKEWTKDLSNSERTHAEKIQERAPAECDACKSRSQLCPTHALEYYIAIQRADAIEFTEGWTAPEILKYRDEHPDDYRADLEYELEELEYNTRSNAALYGITVEDAMKYNTTLQWITGELENLKKYPPRYSKQSERSHPTPLKGRFPSAEQYTRFIELLQEFEIISADGAFIHGHGRKSRLWGACRGASENSALLFSIDSDPEIVATLNDAFPDLKLSQARPQDLRGTKGYNEMRLAFRGASFAH